MRQIVRWSRMSSGRTGGPNRYRKCRNFCSRFDTGNCHSTGPRFMWRSFEDALPTDATNGRGAKHGGSDGARSWANPIHCPPGPQRVLRTILRPCANTGDVETVHGRGASPRNS